MLWGTGMRRKLTRTMLWIDISKYALAADLVYEDLTVS